MADVLAPFGALWKRLRDMGDGTHAEVVYAAGAGGGGGGGGDASAANQTTQITRETEIRDRIGTTTDAAPADAAATGTLSAWLRWIARAIGTPSDAAASSGTLAAMLRALVARLPSALGAQTSAASLSVTVASDQASLPTKVVRFKAPASFNRPADTTAYAAGDAVTNSTSAPAVLQLTVGATNGQAYVITEAVVIRSVKGATLPLFTLYLFPTTFAATNDNAALAIDQTTYESGGAIIPLTEQSSVSARARVGASGLNIVRALASNDTKLYATLQAANAYTPASGETLTVVLYGYLL